MEYEINTIALESLEEFEGRVSGVLDAIRSDGLRPTGIILDEAVKSLVLRGRMEDPRKSDSTILGVGAVTEICGLPVVRWTFEGSARVIAE